MAQTPQIKILSVGSLRANCYIVADQETKEALIVDPGDDADYIMRTLGDLQYSPIQILATHGHFDHIMAARELQLAYKIPFTIHREDNFLVDRMQETAQYFLQREVVEEPPQIDKFLQNEQTVMCGRFSFQIIETPGHTPGSVCLYNSQAKLVLSGDTLFAHGGVGRTDFSYSSTSQIHDSIKSLCLLPEETRLYPGHGEESTIGQESKMQRIHV